MGCWPILFFVDEYICIASCVLVMASVWMTIGLLLLNTAKFAPVRVVVGVESKSHLATLPWHASCMLSHSIYSHSVLDGVYVTFMEAKVANNGYIPFQRIGLTETESAVICHTDKSDCCRSNAQLGDWFYPNGSVILSHTQFQHRSGSLMSHDHPYFARNRDHRLVRLYRTWNSLDNPGLVGSELRGTFHCVVPDKQDNNQTVYINICRFSCYTWIVLAILCVQFFTHSGYSR